MAHDDNNGDLEELKIDRQLYRPTVYRSGGNWIPNGVQNALITAAIIALATSLWNFKDSLAALSQATAVLNTTQQFQQKQLDRLQTRQDSLEGKITRGGPNAPDQQ